MKIHGSCHCGNIRFDLDWQPEPTQIAARACTCSFCRKHGGSWTSNPQGTLDVTVADPLLVSEYAFATKTASFHICARCGAVPVVTCDIEGKTFAVVNVNAFDDVDPALVDHATTTFEGEATDDRLARRVRNWIPRVRFHAAP
ncbi:MAG TPA: hypothetical protein VIE63_15290 [Ramlibacter sp.]|jgi:hypothetical protein